MGTQRESICIVVTLHESIWVGSFICNELPGKKTFNYLCVCEGHINTYARCFVSWNIFVVQFHTDEIEFRKEPFRK